MSEKMTIADAKTMLQRAQDGENRLLEVVAEKDATIKALADALMLIRRNRAVLLHEERVAMDVALRLAGRLP